MHSIICVNAGSVMKKITVLAHSQSLQSHPPPPSRLSLCDWLIPERSPDICRGGEANAEHGEGWGGDPAGEGKCEQDEKRERVKE